MELINLLIFKDEMEIDWFGWSWVQLFGCDRVIIDLEFFFFFFDVTFMGVTSSISTNQPNRRSRAK
jgi:hypothetical protein